MRLVSLCAKRITSQYERFRRKNNRRCTICYDKRKLREKAQEEGIKFTYQELGSYPELKTALTSKRIDAFSVDKSILSGYVDGKTEILKDGFSPQEYGITTKKANTELNDYLNGLIEKWEKDGTLEKNLSRLGLKN